MTTRETTGRTPMRRLATPAVAVVIGIVYLVSGVLGGDRGFGVLGFLLMLGIAVALLVLSRVSETVAGVLDGGDERLSYLDREASLFAGMAVITAVLAGFVIDIARGGDGQPYALLGAIGGVAYVLALTVLRFRR